MSSGDFAAELQQSVNDSLALIHTAAKTAKARIGQAVQEHRAPEAPGPAIDMPSPSRRPAVNFDADESDLDPAFSSAFGEPAAFSEADAFAAEPAPSPLPEGAISFDDLAVEGVDDEGIPVWEDPP